MELAFYLQRLNAIANAGLTYGKDVFDQERYQEMKDVLAELLNETELKETETAEFLRPTSWYPTPLVDVRAFVCNVKNEILLVQHKRKEHWALPGGYAEVGLTPQENVLKELKEEAGVTGKVKRLLAVFDTNCHQFQSQQYYKMVFLCEVEAEKFEDNSEIIQAKYFSLDNLPNLSKDRNTKEQLAILLDAYQKETQWLD